MTEVLKIFYQSGSGFFRATRKRHVKDPRKNSPESDSKTRLPHVDLIIRNRPPKKI